MTLNDLRVELRANNIRETSCLILPATPIEGTLCLLKVDGGRWRVVFIDRGDFTIDETFQSEHEACRFFLKKALFDPVTRKDFKQADLYTWETKRRELAAKYGFEENE